jgi:UDP-N-acetylmuramoyl-tripeptide--D-alanyl-D-alanine ligase
MKSVFKSLLVGILSYEAKLVIKKYNPKIIAITGSVGKTSTKDAVYAVLSKYFSVRRSEKSFNSEIGIPLTILGCQNAWSNPIGWLKNIWVGLDLVMFKHHFPDWLILEVGADHPGDIKSVTKWLKPDITVLTKFAKTPVHIEFFKNREEIIKEKGYLVEALKRDGTIVLNADDNDALTFKGKDNHNTLLYGLESEADLRASYSDLFYENGRLAGITFKIDYEGNSIPVIVKGVVGNQVIYSALAAASVGIACGLNMIKVSEGLLEYISPRGRMKIIPGIKDSIIIDDTYNSSPVAAHSALETLCPIKTVGRKIAVLGDMLELGKHSATEHEELGKLASKCCDMLVTVGLRTRETAEAALTAGMPESNILQFDKSQEAGQYLQNILETGDIVLVKGSQSMRMEKCVEEIMAEPDKAAELLVRQEEEWLNR